MRREAPEHEETTCQHTRDLSSPASFRLGGLRAPAGVVGPLGTAKCGSPNVVTEHQLIRAGGPCRPRRPDCSHRTWPRGDSYILSDIPANLISAPAPARPISQEIMRSASAGVIPANSDSSGLAQLSRLADPSVLPRKAGRPHGRGIRGEILGAAPIVQGQEGDKNGFLTGRVGSLRIQPLSSAPVWPPRWQLRQCHKGA
jgi:hypothetical protein